MENYENKTNREIEIEEASIEYQTIVCGQRCIAGAAFADDEIVRRMNMNKGFCDGAKWADKTTIEKAVKWMRKHVRPYCSNLDEYAIEQFRKEMQE